MMKLLWYADFLSFKRHNHSITGMVYTSMPMGAVPIAHKLIVDLKGISCEEIEFENGSGYKFIESECTTFDSLTKEDVCVLDTIIDMFGKSTKEQIVNKMHKELAYKKTEAGDVISFEYAKDLSIL